MNFTVVIIETVFNRQDMTWANNFSINNTVP